MEIVAFCAHNYPKKFSPYFLKSLRLAISEASFRGLVNSEDFRVAADLAMEKGRLDPQKIGQYSLAELWGRCMPLLESLTSD